MIQLLIAGLVLLFLSFGWMRPARRSSHEAQQAIYATLAQQGATQVRIAASANNTARDGYIYEVRFQDAYGEEQRLICKVPTAQKDGYLYWRQSPAPLMSAQNAARLKGIATQDPDAQEVLAQQRQIIRQLRQENARLQRQVIDLSTQLVRGRSTYGEFLN